MESSKKHIVKRPAGTKRLADVPDTKENLMKKRRDKRGKIAQAHPDDPAKQKQKLDEYDQEMKNTYHDYESVIAASDAASKAVADRRASSNSGGASNVSVEVGSAEPVIAASDAASRAAADGRPGSSSGGASNVSVGVGFAEPIDSAVTPTVGDLGGRNDQGDRIKEQDGVEVATAREMLDHVEVAMFNHTRFAKELTARVIESQNAFEDRDRAFFQEHQLLGDQYRYLAESYDPETEEHKKYVQAAVRAYRSGIDKASLLPPAEGFNPLVLLSLYLSSACFRGYYDPAGAIAMVSAFLPDAESAVQALPEDAENAERRDLLSRALRIFGNIIADCEDLVAMKATIPLPRVNCE